jgi:hypothetical protein
MYNSIKKVLPKNSIQVITDFTVGPKFPIPGQYLLCHERKQMVKIIFCALFNQKRGINHVSIYSVDIKTKQKNI